jgi:hypothetical protein
MQTLCPNCGTPFTCNPNAGCWCAELPNLMPVPNPGTGACLCRNCLTAKLQAAPKPEDSPQIIGTGKI